MNLADLREAIRVKTGYPERGESGTRRINNIINQSLRTLWGEIPEVLLRDEERVQLEPQRSCTVTRDAADPKVFKITLGEAPFTTAEIGSKILSARWFEWQFNGNWYQRRIAEVGTFVTSGVTHLIVVVSEPVPTEAASVSVVMDANIYTYEYPYDADIQAIKRIVKNPETNPREIPLSLIGSEMTSAKIGSGWQSEGQVQYFSRGDFYQQDAPHYKIASSLIVNKIDGTVKWGFNPATSAEDTSFGPAGEFSYKVCHVWGRYPMEMGQIDGGDNDPDSGHPFYISSPSKASDIVSTEWDKSAISLKFPDIDYVYGFGKNPAINSFHKSGIEKWVFRARHKTSVLNPSGSSLTGSSHGDLMENDGIYYLWKIIDGETTEVLDHGQMDPVSRKYQLKDFMGHYHMRFDKRPTAKDQILMSCVRRPPTLNYDTDSPNLPPECYSCILELSCSYLVGDRDGDLKRKSLYYDAHLIELQKLKRMYTFSGHERPSFGNGIGVTSYRRGGDYPVTETS